MTEDFNKWWNADQGYDGVTNPYRSDSAVYWAWEGWQAGVEAEREKCVQLCFSISNHNHGDAAGMAAHCGERIRARGQG
jgi:hypothetical protein